MASSRLDAATGHRLLATAPSHEGRRVAVIGGGLSGLICAHLLAARQIDVVVFDKGRTPGGRLASRRVGETTFDLGAQYFTVRDPLFQQHVNAWEAAQIVGRWTGRIVALDGLGGRPRDTEPITRWVGIPTMSAIGRHLAKGLNVRTSHRVDNLAMVSGRWVLTGQAAPAGTTLAPHAQVGDPFVLEGFDAVAVCLPADQARPLVAAVAPDIDAALGTIVMTPCLALAVSFPAASPSATLPFDGAFIGRDEDGLPLSWIARDASKPLRTKGEHWMLHAGPGWSASRFDADQVVVVRELLVAFEQATGVSLPPPTQLHLHRWRYARIGSGVQYGAWVNTATRLACGGDFASGGRVEGAFCSGVAVANRLLEVLAPATGESPSSTPTAAL